MPSCSVKWCPKNTTNSSFKRDGITFHRFPKIPEIKEKWLEATHRENWFPTEHNVICSRHFTPDCFDATKKVRRLFSSAVPTLLLPVLSSQKHQPSHSEDQTSSQSNQTDHIEPSYVDDSTNSTTLTDLQRDEYTPRELRMKRRIEHLIHILNSKRKDVKRLQDKNRSQTRKYERLKGIMSTLTDKGFITEKNYIMYRKRKEKLKRLKMKNKSATKKYAQLKDVLSLLKDKGFIDWDTKYLFDSLNLHNDSIMKRPVQKSASGVTRITIRSHHLKLFALTLHFYSPKGYSFIRRTFNTFLPPISILRKWYQTVNGRAGFSKEVIDIIKKKASESDQKIYATIISGETDINKNAAYHSKGPEGATIYGYINFGIDFKADCVDESRTALVFILVPMNASWKIPIGYFLLSHVTAEYKGRLLTQAIHLVEDAGISVRAVTFDDNPLNLRIARDFGCVFEPDKIISTFKNPCNETKIAVFIDPAYMVHWVRNTFEICENFRGKNGETVSWQHIANVNKASRDNIRQTKRLKALDKDSKTTNIRITIPIFSKQFLEGLVVCKEQLQLPQFQNAEPTVRFIELMTDLYDILDSSIHGSGFKKAVNVDNADNVLGKLTEAKDQLLNLSAKTSVRNENSKKKNVALIKSVHNTGFRGLYICIESASFLIKDLVLTTSNLEDLPFHKISLDHLEHFFRSIKRLIGSDGDPFAHQFQSAYQELLIIGQIIKTEGGNCSAFNHMLVLPFASAVDRINMTTRHRDEKPEELRTRKQRTWLDEFDLSKPDLSELEKFSNVPKYGEAVIEYGADYASHELAKELDCRTCIGALVNASNTDCLKYSNTQFRPSNTVMEICRRCEIHIRRAKNESSDGGVVKMLPPKYDTDYFVRTVSESLIGTDIFPDIRYHQFEVETANYLVELARGVMTKYVNARLTLFYENMMKRQMFEQTLAALRQSF